jgi:hypothetical protein
MYQRHSFMERLREVFLRELQDLRGSRVDGGKEGQLGVLAPSPSGDLLLFEYIIGVCVCISPLRLASLSTNSSH